MPRKSKRNKSKRNVNAICSLNAQSHQRASLLKSQDKSDKEIKEPFVASHKLSSKNNSHCSSLPASCKPDNEPSLPSQRTKSTKSNSNKISSPRCRSSGKVSSYSVSSKRTHTARTAAQSFHRHESSSKKHSEIGFKKEKAEKAAGRRGDEKIGDLKLKLDKDSSADKKSKSGNLDKSKERLRLEQREAAERKFTTEKSNDKDKVYQTGRNSMNIGPILGWKQVKSNGNRGNRPLSSKIINITRPKISTDCSPLANNRFYELSTKTPDTEESRSIRAHQGAIPKRKIIGHGTAAQAKDDSLRTFSTLDAQRSPKKFQAKKRTNLFGTYLNADGTRSQISNWQQNQNFGPIWEPSSSYALGRILPQPKPIVVLPPAPLRRIESYCNFPKKSSRHNFSVSNVPPKMAPLRNLCESGREIWVNKPGHALSNTQRGVKILPSHHECGGVERHLTPNDADVKNIVCKLEQHERLPKPGTKPTPCTCFRAARRSFCMSCKTNLIGRPFRKCQLHPDIGFSTDHYYCPFCLADAMMLKEL